MQRSPWLLFTSAVILILISSAVSAAEWPKSLNLAGFTISDIKGTINADGSGKGSGKLKLPGASEVPVNLTRAKSGSIRASASQRVTIGGTSIDGSFELDNSGLKGTGTIRIDNQEIKDSSYRMDSKGTLTGNGKADFGTFSIPVSFNIDGTRLSLNGAAARQVSTDTPLAHYSFKGQLQLASNSGSVAVKATGIIERRGKVGNIANTFGPMSSSVNPKNGQTTFNVAGVNVNFRMW